MITRVRQFAAFGLLAAALAVVQALPAAAGGDRPPGEARLPYYGHVDPVRLGPLDEGLLAAASVGTPACPMTIRSAEFGDVSRASRHAAAIDCLAWWGVSVGNTARQYVPADPISRGQNASFLARALDMTSAPLPAAGVLPLPVGTTLSDVAGDNTHAAAIRRVVAAEVMRARPDGTFRGHQPLRRDEMAVALVAAHDRIVGDEPAAASPGPFVDLGRHPDAPAIERAAHLGFTQGVTVDRFDPGGIVNRAQMAAFLTRLLDRLVAEGHALAPTVPSWGDAPPGRRPPPKADPNEGTAYSFMGKRSDGTPIRWNPCERLPVHANYNGAPAGADRALARAVREIASATGVDVHLAGTTSVRAPSGGGVPIVEGRLVVAWDRIGDPFLIGIGGPMWRGWNGDERIVGGGVTMNSNWRPESQASLELGLMHELGHAIGLDHASLRTEVMYPVQMPGQQAVWGPGDRAGLWLLGRGSGCL